MPQIIMHLQLIQSSLSLSWGQYLEFNIWLENGICWNPIHMWFIIVASIPLKSYTSKECYCHETQGNSRSRKTENEYIYFWWLIFWGERIWPPWMAWLISAPTLQWDVAMNIVNYTIIHILCTHFIVMRMVDVSKTYNMQLLFLKIYYSPVKWILLNKSQHYTV